MHHCGGDLNKGRIIELKKKYPEITILIEATEEEMDWLKQKKGK